MSGNRKQVARPRAVSARPSRQRSRPSSGKARHEISKTDDADNFMEAIYAINKFKHMPLTAKKIEQDTMYKKLDHTKSLKEKEELIQDNVKLKKQINRLNEKLGNNRTKMEQMRKKTSDYSKKLNIQFQKQIYWSGTQANMIRGIKSQYQQTKLKYQAKCLQFDQVTKDFLFLKNQQNRQERNKYQEENAILVKIVQEAYNDLKSLEYGTITSQVEQEMEAQKLFRYELKQKNDQLRAKNEKNKVKIKALEDCILARNTKIQYLDKLLVQRDNAQHAAVRKMKKTQKQKSDLDAKYQQLQNEKENMITIYEQKLQKLKQVAQKQSQTQRFIFRKQIVEKQDRILKLQKQVAYLTTLLSYWKPLDQINDLVANGANQQNKSEHSDTKQIVLEYSMNSTFVKMQASKSRFPQKIIQEESEPKNMMISKSRRGSAEQNRNMSDVMTKSINVFNEAQPKAQKKKRQRITADCRNSQQGAKVRRISSNQIKDICQMLKYRFLFQGISMDQVRSQFDYKPQLMLLDDEQEQAWQMQYINMKEAKNILLNATFSLHQQDAQIFSRYLIEDSNNQYVYCDPRNEHLRTVVKSIIKSSIGQYSLPSNKQQIQKKSNEIIHKYITNLEPALKTSFPKGQVTKQKLLELFKGLGIQISKDVQNYYIGKLVLSSANLNKMQYKILFQNI